MVNTVLACSATCLILPEALWELQHRASGWHAYLATVVAIAAMANHMTTSSECMYVDRLLVWCIGLVNFMLAPVEVLAFGVIIAVLYFGLVRRTYLPMRARTGIHVLIHVLGVITNVLAVRSLERVGQSSSSLLTVLPSDSDKSTSSTTVL